MTAISELIKSYNPNTIDGTEARICDMNLIRFISFSFVAYSTIYIALPTPIGMDIKLAMVIK